MDGNDFTDGYAHPSVYLTPMVWEMDDLSDEQVIAPKYTFFSAIDTNQILFTVSAVCRY
jgi:hypothetical protein